MLLFLETGQALYVLAAVCLMGILTRAVTKNLYKRLGKESANLTLTKNRKLKEFKQKAENAWRVNQGLRDSGAWLEHQLNQMRFGGMTLNGWSALSAQMTWLCLLLGGVGAFLAYWYRLDTYYIVLYGGGSVLLSMLTMLFDGGGQSWRRDQLVTALQDYMENVMCPRMSRTAGSEETMAEETGEMERKAARGIGRLAKRNSYQEAEVQSERTGRLAASARKERQNRRELNRQPVSGTEETEGARDADYLKRSLEQIAASREKNRSSDENWLQGLRPEEIQVLGDILKEYLV